MYELEKYPLKVLITITDRGKGKKVVEINEKHGVTFQTICLGTGTASKQMLQILGIGETQKDVIFSVIKSDICKEILNDLEKLLDFNLPGHGISFTIPIEAVSSLKVLNVLLGNKVEG